MVAVQAVDYNTCVLHVVLHGILTIYSNVSSRCLWQPCGSLRLQWFSFSNCHYCGYSIIHIGHDVTASTRTKTISSPINLGSLCTHRHSTYFSLHWPSCAVQVCTSTVNEHVLELFVVIKKALIRSGGKSYNILDEFGLPVKVVGFIKYVYMNRLVTSGWKMYVWHISYGEWSATRRVLEGDEGSACGAEGGGRVVGKLTGRDRLEVRGLDGRKTLNWILKEWYFEGAEW